ncbi:MAG: M14 family metallopeptidase [Candidatus Aminicenantia bacterium]
MRNKRILCAFLGIAFFLAFLSPQSFCSTEVNLSFDHFYDHAELTKALKTLAKAYPQFMTLKSIGKSYQGREIWAVILNNPKTGPDKHKPGFYIDANIHGNEIQGTEVALYTVWYLLKNYGKNELITRLLDEKAFYVVPTMNPDSRDYYINKASDPNSPRTGLMPYDDDRDGVADEDGPEDLDGDGSITQMRKRDPNGNFKTHPDDPRILIPVRPGEKGEYILLGQEGIDNDGDGRINEDGPGGYDMNRNYGYNWQPHYVQYGAGKYPFCFPETRAVCNFLLEHPNIAGAQNFHNYGGMILRGPGAKNMGEYPIADKRIYDYIGKKGEKILPDYRYIIVYKDMYTVYGGSIDFLYCTLGIFTFTNELDTDLFETLPFGKKEKEEDKELSQMRSLLRRLNEMIYQDIVLMGEQYSEWKPYKHPLYGDIEIGGFKKFGRRVPPLFKLAETCHRNMAFCLFHADQLARLTFDKVEVKKLNRDLYQLDVTILNTRVTPTMSAIAIQKKLHRSDRFEIKGKKVKLLAAGKLTDIFRGITQKRKIHNNSFWVEKGVPSFGKVDLRLLVKGKGKITLVYDSLKGGYHTKRITLK